jgi:hypothetical protein
MRLTSLVVVGALASASLLVSGGTAFADPDPAPVCVKTHITHPGAIFTKVDVVNNCTEDVRVKILWARLADTDCEQLAPGQGFNDFRGTGISGFDGVQSC